MKITKQAQRNARQLFRSCLANGSLDENRVRQAVSLVLAQKPRGYIEILSRLLRLVKLDLDRRAAHVESAVPLPDVDAKPLPAPAKAAEAKAAASEPPPPAGEEPPMPRPTKQ